MCLVTWPLNESEASVIIIIVYSTPLLENKTPELQWWVIYTLLETYSYKIINSLSVALNLLIALLT